MNRGRTVLSLTIIVIVLSSSFGCFLSSVSADDGDNIGYKYNFTSFYDQLSDNAKSIYDGLNAATADDLIVKIEFKDVLYSDSESGINHMKSLINDDIRAAFVALQQEKPLAICTWGNSSLRIESYMMTDNTELTGIKGVTIVIEVDPNYADDPNTADVNELQVKVDALNAAISGYDVGTDDLRKRVGNINSYLTSRLTYDKNAGTDKEDPYVHDAYGALVSESKVAVCDGYSRAFQALCQKYGISCFTIVGYSIPDLKGHAWNAVKMDNDKWYPVDVTWNDTNSNATLLSSAADFNKDHQAGLYPSSNGAYFDYPVYSETKYDADPWFESEYLKYIVIAAIGGAIIIGLLLAIREDKKKSGPKV